MRETEGDTCPPPLTSSPIVITPRPEPTNELVTNFLLLHLNIIYSFNNSLLISISYRVRTNNIRSVHTKYPPTPFQCSRAQGYLPH